MNDCVKFVCEEICDYIVEVLQDERYSPETKAETTSKLLNSMKGVINNES